MSRYVCISVFVLAFTPRLPAFQDAAPGRDKKGAPTASYLNTSFQAAEALDQARKQFDAGEWMASAAAYQETAEKFGDFLISVDGRRLVSNRRFVNQQISGWPREALDAYRTAFEGRARRAFESAMESGDTAGVVDVSERFFPTDAAAAALNEAGERAIESGDFKSARRWFERLAREHPDRDAPRPTGGENDDRPTNGDAWRAKAALCAAYSGDSSPLRTLVSELETEKPKSRIPWGGREQGLGEMLRAVLAERAPAEAEGLHKPAVCGTPMLAAAPDRTGYVQSAAQAEARLWGFSAFGRALWDEEFAGYESQVARKDAWIRMLQSGRMLAFLPVAGCPARPDESAWIFLHDATSAWAVDTARPETPVWRFDLPGAGTSHQSLIAEDEPPPLYSGLLEDGKFYVPMEREQASSPTGPSAGGLLASALVCLDARSGQLVWQNNLEEFTSPFEEARLDGAPLFHRGKLFAVARRRKPFGFEACYLLRLDAKTGRILSTVHLGESATGSYGYHRATLTHPAADGDLVFVQTNLGTIAAVGADTGRVEWIATYESKYADTPDGFWPARMGRPTRSWQYPAVVAWRDAIVCMPLDADHVMLLKQSDGSEVFRVGLDKIGFPEMIVGARDELLYLAGAQVMCYDLSMNSPVWQRPLEGGQLFGRGAITTGGLFVPTDRGLARYPLEGGPCTLYPWSLDLAGNVIALPDQLVIATATGLYGLSGKDDAFARLTRRMEAAPRDPAAALALAELAFHSGEEDRGLAAVQQAIERMGGFARISDDEIRRRLFESLMKFAAQTLDRPESRRAEGKALDSAAASAQTAITLLKMAGQCAPDSAGQVGYRLKLARAQLGARQPAAAAETYQQILADRGLRATRVRVSADVHPSGYRFAAEIGGVEGDDSLVEAGALVTQWIDRLIVEHGRAVYDAVETRAQDRLRIAQGAPDGAALLAVADAFPNSRAAQKALHAHARMSARQHEYDAASRSYRRSLAGADSKGRPEMLAEYAAVLCQAGQFDQAAEWLDRGARWFPGHRLDQEGRSIGFEQYRERLLGRRIFRDPACAAGRWPVHEGFKRLYPDRITILDPVFCQLPATRWDTLITYCGTQLEARHPLTGAAMWSRPVACANQPQLLGMDDAHFVFATGHRVFALTRTSGQLAWSVGAEPADDPMQDPESTASWTCHALTADRFYGAVDQGELFCIDLADGNIRWRKQTDPNMNHQLAADDRHVCLASWQGRQHTIQILSAATGEAISSARPEDEWPVQSLAMARDGTLLAVFAGAIHGIEPKTGQTRWRAGSADRFVPATLNFDEEGVVVSPDGRRLVKYDTQSGRLLWTSPPVTSAAADGIWAQASGGAVFAACGDSLAAIDLADGRPLWTAACPAGLRPEPPRLLDDSLVVVSTPRTAEPGAKAAAREEPARVYQVVRYRRTDGERQPVTGNRALTTEPLSSFGGLYARDHGLIVLDGNRMFGYVGRQD
jgi:outer membrane protein assembly factor BamB/tetratricopeptide (TPR) repeat protein